MSQVIGYEPCPRCREKGKDSRGDNFVRWSDGSGHCFACRYHKFPTHYIPVEKTKVDHNVKSLPSDFTREVPTKAWKWLLQYGLGYRYWQEYCGYSPAEQRLVFTVGKPVAFSIGRYMADCDESPGRIEGGNREGSYREGSRISCIPSEPRKRIRKWYTWGESHKHTEVISPTKDSESQGITVLVEDLISAHKVGQVATCIPLFGVEIHPCHLYTLRNGSRSPVVLWLDADQGGSTGKKALRLQSLVNRPVRVVSTEKDPKWYNPTEIQEIIDKL